jgi:uracil-DNA glycosylase family 4
MNTRIKSRLELLARSEKAMGMSGAVVGAKPAKKKSPLKAVPTPAPSTAPKSFPPPKAAPLPLVPPRAVPLAKVAAAASLMSAAPIDGPGLSTEEKREQLAAMDVNEVRGCRKCRLCEGRTQTVFGEGDVDARVMFVGEGPGRTEDETGRPFVGRAGELLAKMIGAMGLSREQVYIANVVKCRPPDNRTPAPDEVATCTPYLERQLQIIRPKAIVTLGLPASRYLLSSNLSMGKLRGNWQSWRGIPVMPTFHPSYVLRVYTPETRAAVWSDLKQVMELLGKSSGA